ncbi:MAG: 50S ribosome-binding GTPase, partial [Planctomycetota bacterium]|nr:50S ribosome-binding GTPase [Planctomycetota bacterium]
MGAKASTICAVASAPGGGARAVVRLSGPDTAALVKALARVDGEPLVLTQRGLHAVELDDGIGVQPALVLWMPGPGSYTREDVAELHVVGSAPLVRAVQGRLLEAGAVLAEPGEFTRRAFLNGRLDLTRAEGVLELIEARSAEERRAATALLVGGLDERIAILRDELEELRAITEASLDFDETDTGHIPIEDLAARARISLAGIRAASAWEARREPASGLPRVVLTGAPNAGKSSLFNRLVDAQLPALVSDHAGTTRDVLRGTWALKTRRVELCDTAGRDAAAAGVADRAGQAQMASARETADLVLCVVDATTVPAFDPAEDPAFDPAVAGADLVVWNQIDRAEARPAPRASVPVSAVTGAGLEALA